MPAGISHSIVTPGALAQRSAPETGRMESRNRGTESSAAVENPQAVLAASSDQLVRAPDPETGGQRAENQLAAGSAAATGSSGREPAGSPGASQPTAQPPGLQALQAGGIGGNLDLTV